MTSRERTPEDPYPVRVIAQRIAGWIARLGVVWMEGEVAQLNVRANNAFLTLRDTEASYSLPISCPVSVISAVPDGLAEGARIVVHCRPEFYAQRGSFAMRATEIRHVGIGDLLARIERLRKALAAEGLFDPARKRPLPFLPSRIGLITGRDSAAEQDVLKNVHLRWPAARFRTEYCAVQGRNAAQEIAAAINRLDQDPGVDVIIVARGGGSVEDLLPFSDETLCRVAFAATTPIISAVGHESDHPLLDWVSDVRASTPTDAAKRVVPDVRQEQAQIQLARQRIRASVQRRIDQGYALLEQVTSRPAQADPSILITGPRTQIQLQTAQIRRALSHLLTVERGAIQAVRAKVVALSPSATLERGYAVVMRHDGSVVTDPHQPPGTRLSIRVARGRLNATVTEPDKDSR